MGFFSKIGEALFGTETKKKAAAATAATQQAQTGAAQQAAQLGAGYRAQGQQYDTGVSQSMGANAGEYMKKAQEAGKKSAPLPPPAQ